MKTHSACILVNQFYNLFVYAFTSIWGVSNTFVKLYVFRMLFFSQIYSNHALHRSDKSWRFKYTYFVDSFWSIGDIVHCILSINTSNVFDLSRNECSCRSVKDVKPCLQRVAANGACDFSILVDIIEAVYENLFNVFDVANASCTGR